MPALHLLPAYYSTHPAALPQELNHFISEFADRARAAPGELCIVLLTGDEVGMQGGGGGICWPAGGQPLSSLPANLGRACG